MDKNKLYSLIYPLVLMTFAVALLVALGVNGLFHWSYTLTFLTVACIFAEWQVIRLPQGNSLTLSIIFVLLALVFDFEETSDLQRAVGAMQVIAIGSLVGYGVTRRSPPLHRALYVAHYVLAASAAGYAFILVSENVSRGPISSFHLPAVAAYTVLFSLLSMLLVGLFNARILKGEKLPKADILYTIFLAPIALIVFYFFESRDLGWVSLPILALPLVGVLITFTLYVNIDTRHGEVKQLYEISREFVAAMSSEETVQKIGESIAQAISELVLRLDACLVYEHNEDANEYKLVTTNGNEYGPASIRPRDGLLARVAFGGTGRIINDVMLEDGLSPKEREWPAKIAVLAHPLPAEHRDVGLLVLLRRGRGFTAEEFRLVSIVANQAGVTLHNARLYEESRRVADIDRQLGVLNQAAFTDRSEHILGRARIDGQPVALLYPDIDDFRDVNNTYGHPTGDRVLEGVANLMKEVVGEAGLVGRSGGEEFFILLPNVDEREAVAIADEIRQRIHDYVFKSEDGREVRATISTGVAVFPRDAGEIESLIEKADKAAFLAKRMGKDRVCPYEDRREMFESAQGPESPVASSVAQERGR